MVAALLGSRPVQAQSAATVSVRATVNRSCQIRTLHPVLDFGTLTPRPGTRSRASVSLDIACNTESQDRLEVRLSGEVWVAGENSPRLITNVIPLRVNSTSLGGVQRRLVHTQVPAERLPYSVYLSVQAVGGHLTTLTLDGQVTIPAQAPEPLHGRYTDSFVIQVMAP